MLAHVGSMLAHVGPSGLQDGPIWLQVGPSWPHDAIMLAQVGLEMPKMASNLGGKLWKVHCVLKSVFFAY